MKHIFIFGAICSGKSTLAQQYASQGTYQHIEVSHIVKRLSNVDNRKELTQTKSLDKNIAKEIYKEIVSTPKPCVISGIRQKSIVEYLVREIGSDKILFVHKDVPTSVRKKRFEERGSTKDNITFEEAEKLDDVLGLSDVVKFIYKYPVTILKD